MDPVLRGSDTQAGRPLKGVSSVLAFAASAAFVHAAHPQTLQKLAAYQGEDRQQQLIQGARKEGSLLFYTTFPTENTDRLIEPFKNRYGIKVEVWRARSEIVLQRVIAEARAGSLNVDVITIISPAAEALRRENLLQEIRSPHHGDLIPFAMPAHREWAPTLQHVFVQAYNTGKVRKEDLPKTYEDLLSPKWKGKLAIEGDDHEWMSSVIADMGQARGVKFFRDLVAGNGLSVRSGHALLTNLVASGEVPLALTVYQYSVEQAKKKGSPIDWFVIGPAVSIGNGIGVFKRAPHPHAALLFYDYIIGPEGQRLLAKIGYVPANVRIESPVERAKLKFLDAETLLGEQEKSFSLFEQIILKGAAR
jgi:iron(III) transport system substrate-binding protein